MAQNGAAADAFERVMVSVNGDMRLALALVDRVAASPSFFSNDLALHADELVKYYQEQPVHKQAAEMETSRLHPYASRVIKDIHQIIHPGGNRNHVTRMGTLDLENFIKAKEVLIDLIEVASAKRARPLSGELLSEVRQGYTQQPNVQGFVGEDLRNIQKETCSNLCFAEVLLYPPTQDCPFCNREMQQSQTLPDAVVVITSEGLKYGRHYEYTCNRSDCPRQGCSRHYDAVSYKAHPDDTELIWQLERPDWSVDGPNNYHQNQPRHKKLDYIQVCSRVFMCKRFARETSLRLYLTKSSFIDAANAWLDLNRFRESEAVQFIQDSTFLDLFRNARSSVQQLSRYFQRAFYLYFLTETWLKTSYGQPIYVNLRPGVFPNAATFPGINPHQGNPDQFLTPLKQFIRAFGGQLKIVAAVEARSNALNPGLGDFGAALEGLIELFLACILDTRREEGLHRCDDCSKRNPTTDHLVSCANIDSVPMRMPCCSSGDQEHDACNNPLVNDQERFRSVCLPLYGDKYGMVGSDTLSAPNSNACHLHQAELLEFSNESKGNVRWRMLSHIREKSEEGNINIDKLAAELGIPRDISDMLSSASADLLTFENNQLPLARNVDDALQSMHDAIVQMLGLEHQFDRKFTNCDTYLCRPCGHVVSRRLAYRSESMATVLTQILVATDGGRTEVPTYLFYDRACALLYYMAGLCTTHRNTQLPTRNMYRVFKLPDFKRLFKRMFPTCDPLQSEHHHRQYLSAVCDLNCCPYVARNPAQRDLFVNGHNNDRLFNRDLQENASDAFGPLSTLVNSMTTAHGQLTLEVMAAIHNEVILSKQLRRGKNPRYLDPAALAAAP